jgi:hypothetical protein
MTSSHTTPRYGRFYDQLEYLSKSHTESYLQIIDVVDFVKDHPLDIPDEISSLVEHAAQDLCSHDETARFRVYLHVSSQNTNVFRPKSFLEVPIFLIR